MFAIGVLGLKEGRVLWYVRLASNESAEGLGEGGSTARRITRSIKVA